MSDKFFLGRLYDSTQAKVTEKPLQYDPADLTTHAVVTGMTGSGKTGLCIALMEEADRQQALDLAGGQWGQVVNNITEIPVLPKKTDIYVNAFGVAWIPCYQV